MRLLIIRHAIAADGMPDAERPLTPKGRRRMRRAADGLKELVPELDAIATSGLVRARQTAEIVAKRYSMEPEVLELLQPEAPMERLVEWFNHSEHEVLAVVGHEPGLSTLVKRLTGSQVTLGKGGACLVDGQTLEWLLTPKQLRIVGRG
jgi:phosphohistidine phosphatase